MIALSTRLHTAAMQLAALDRADAQPTREEWRALALMLSGIADQVSILEACSRPRYRRECRPTPISALVGRIVRRARCP